jgi:hypothetical protein
MATPGAIYSEIDKRSPRAVLPEAWGRRPCPRDVFMVPEDTAGLERCLRRGFNENDLLASGAFVKVPPDSAPVLSPLLRHGGAFALPIRTSQNSRPLDIVVRSRSLSGQRTAWRALLCHYRNAQLTTKDSPEMYAAFDEADVAAFWALGLPCIHARGLHFAKQEDIEILIRVLGMPLTQEGLLGPPEPFCFIPLTIVNWSPASLTLADAVGSVEVIRHLRRLCQFVRVPLHEFGVWKPTPKEADRIRFCLQVGERPSVLEAVEDSAANAIALMAKPAPKTAGIGKYAEAMSQWRRASDEPTDSIHVREAWQQVLRSQQEALIDPLLRAAEEANDPMDRNLHAVVAHLSRLVHPLALTLAATPTGPVDARLTPAGYPAEELGQLIKLTNQILVLSRELRCPSIQKVFHKSMHTNRQNGSSGTSASMTKPSPDLRVKDSSTGRQEAADTRCTN